METLMSHYSLRHWWVFVFRGILFSSASGIYVFMSPASAYIALSFLFGFGYFTGWDCWSYCMPTRIAVRRNRGWHLFIGIH